MRKTLFYILLGCLTLLMASCGKNINLTDPDISDPAALAFGTEETFDIVTWNIENFPKRDPETSDLLKTLLPALKADCIAIQEVNNISAFHSLVSKIPGWSYRISSSGDTQTAVMYDTSTVQVDSSATIFTDMSNPFPRPPLLMKIRWQQQELVLISLHLKAFGDNVIDEADAWDEEVRRRYACQLLDQYIAENFGSSKVLVVGDMNDQIQEAEASNVFLSFIGKPAEYKFADMGIAQNLSSQNCSYPPSSSHIDHILMSNELFYDFSRSGNYALTIRMELKVVGGWFNYDKYLSDHRPVAARFKIMPETGTI